MYVEWSVNGGLAELASCGWSRTATRSAPVRIVPDACMDIVWTGRGLLVAGPDTQPWQYAMGGHSCTIGLRFAPGQGSRVLAVPASALRNARVELSELWGDRALALADRLAEAGDPRRAMAELGRAVLAVRGAVLPADPLVQQVIARVQQPGPRVSVSALAGELGVGERQLLRRCTAALGYGPKLLERILRFQRFLAALRARPGRSLAEHALALGYADQAHLAHDTAELAGAAPRQLQAEQLA